MGKVRVVETSDGKDAWVTSDKDYFEKDGRMYFRGVVTERQDLALAKREAKAEAVKNIAEKINVRVRTEFEAAARGSNVTAEGLSGFVEDAVAWVSENLNIQGISPEKTYWERAEKVTPEGLKYSYNVYVLCQIPITDYEKARSLALNALLRKYQQEGNKAAEEVAGQVKEKLLERP